MNERERTWIERIQSGDEEAFREMFSAYYPRLCRFAAEYVDSPDWARDLVQDVFLKIWEQRAGWEVRSSLKAYLYRAVRNQALNQVRQNDTRHEVQDDLEYTTEGAERQTADETVHAQRLSEEVEEKISELPERRRMAFLLHRRHGFTYKEVAHIMGITPKTVENQIGRALKSLREKVDFLFSRELT